VQASITGTMGAVLPPFMPAFQMGPMPGMHMQLEDEAKRGFAQICFDFTKGTCLRGDACKYSHDIAHIVQVIGSPTQRQRQCTLLIVQPYHVRQMMLSLPL